MAQETRTPPVDAMTRIAEWLNLYAGRTVSMNELARHAGLAWATTKKYTDALARLQHVLPGIRITEDGCEVLHASAAMHETVEDPLARNTLTLWMLAREMDLAEGLPKTSIDLSEAISSLEDMQFIEKAGHGIRFTKPGLSYANSIYGDIIRYCEELPSDDDEGIDADDFDDEANMSRNRIHKGAAEGETLNRQAGAA